MLKKTIKYVDYNGTERTEDFHFNLTQAEIMEMELGTSGGLAETLEKIVAAQDAPTIVSMFKKIILKSYGEKSPDGRRFIKGDDVSTAFAQTEAYSQLFMELSTDANAAADFIKGIMPQTVEQPSAVPKPPENKQPVPFPGS